MMDQLLPQLHAVLATTAQRWLNLTETLPIDLLHRPPTPGEWSAVECLRHLRDAERDVFQLRTRRFLGGQDLVPYEPERDGRLDVGETPAELAAEFAQLRTETLSLLADLTDQDLARTVNHGEYGPVRLGEMLHYWAAHDLMHTVQAERALMQPFIAGSGPWRPMTRDHDLGTDLS